MNSKEKFELAFGLLCKLIDFGSNLDSQDSYGNNCAMRVSLDARQLSNGFNSSELDEDLRRIFKKLKESGVKFDTSTIERESPVKLFKNDSVIKYII